MLRRTGVLHKVHRASFGGVGSAAFAAGMPSSSARTFARYAIRRGGSEPGFNKDSLALVRFRQHIFKAALRTFRGMLSPTLLARVLGEVARHPGM